MNIKQKKSVEVLKQEVERVIKFFRDSVEEIMDAQKATAIRIKALTELKDVCVDAFKKGVSQSSKSENIGILVSYVDKVLTTTISKSKIEGVDTINIGDFKKACEIVMAANRATLNFKK